MPSSTAPRLPGLEPHYVRLTVHNRGLGVIDLEVWAGDDLRYVAAVDATVYEALDPATLQDVVAAILDGLVPPTY